jgi:hypothetical protein
VGACGRHTSRVSEGCCKITLSEKRCMYENLRVTCQQVINFCLACALLVSNLWRQTGNALQGFPSRLAQSQDSILPAAR